MAILLKKSIIIVFCILFGILLVISGVFLFRTKEPENTDYFLLDGSIYKIEPELKPEQVSLAAAKINEHISAHPEAENIYLAVIPDKSYYTASKNGYPSMDYQALISQLCNDVPQAEYIDLTDILDAGDYYRTDNHWRQEAILPVAQALCTAMGVKAPQVSDFTPTLVGEFSGVSSRLSGLEAEPDELYIMESSATKTALVTSAETDGYVSVYSPEKLTGKEPYDVYLSGAQAALTIENPYSDTDKELIIFRDSFASSLTPLLTGSYAKITLIDLRYIISDLVPDYADFDGADVLFLYSTSLLNSGGILR